MHDSEPIVAIRHTMTFVGTNLHDIDLIEGDWESVDFELGFLAMLTVLD